MSKWVLQKAAEFCASVRDGTHDSPKSVEGGGKPLVTSKVVKQGVVQVEDAYLISEKDYRKINERSKVDRWDILMTMIGTVGECAIVKDDPDYAIKNIALFKMSGDEEKAKWLYYYLTSPMGQGALRGNFRGSSQQYISLDQLRNLEIPVPEKNVRSQIVAILSDYDSAIDNARRQIALLEEAAMRLYREWFVVHANPKWEKRRIGDVIEFNPKVQIPKETVHEIVPMSALQVNSMILDSATIEYGISKSGSKFTNGDTLLARITPCLENGKTAFVGNLKSSCGASGSTEFIVMRSKKLNPYMVYLIARTPDFREAAIKSMSGADGRQRAKEDILKNIPYRLPSEGLIKKFGDVAEPMFNRAYLLQSQIESLTEARDRLLPKLMSGEIEV